MSKLFLYLTMTMVMLIWGFNVIAIKVIVEHFAPIMITAIRVLIAFFVLFTVLSFKREIRKLSRKETAFVAAAAFTGVFAHQLCVAFGLKYTTASNSGLILGLVPLVTSVLSVIMLGQRLSAFRIGGIFCGLLRFRDCVVRRRTPAGNGGR